MGPTWNPARRQKTGLWTNGEGTGVGTGVVCQKDVLIWLLHPVSGLPTCGRAPQYSAAGQEDSIWSAPTWQLCLWSLKSVNVFPRPLGTWMSLQAKSHGVGGIQGMTLHKVKSSALHVLHAALPELVGFLLKEGSAPIPLSNSFSANAN